MHDPDAQRRLAAIQLRCEAVEREVREYLVWALAADTDFGREFYVPYAPPFFRQQDSKSPSPAQHWWSNVVRDKLAPQPPTTAA
jgi:hypothetical protein